MYIFVGANESIKLIQTYYVHFILLLLLKMLLILFDNGYYLVGTDGLSQTALQLSSLDLCNKLI